MLVFGVKDDEVIKVGDSPALLVRVYSQDGNLRIAFHGDHEAFEIKRVSRSEHWPKSLQESEDRA